MRCRAGRRPVSIFRCSQSQRGTSRGAPRRVEQAKALEAELERARSETADAIKGASSLKVALNEIKRRPVVAVAPVSKTNGDDEFDKFVASRPDLQQLYIQQQTSRFLT